MIKIRALKDNKLYGLNITEEGNYTLNGSLKVKVVTRDATEVYINDTRIECAKTYTIEHYRITAYDTFQSFEFNKQFIEIGQAKHSEINIQPFHHQLLLEQDKVTQFATLTCEAPLYINYSLSNTPVTLSNGDEWYIDDTLFIYKVDYLEIYTTAQIETSLNEIETNTQINTNEYRRKPRIIRREPTDKVVIEKVPSKPTRSNNGLWRMIIPPFVMIILTIVVFIFRPTGIYIIMMLGMSIVTIIMSISQYVSDKNKFQKDTKTREVTYTRYLKDKTRQLYALTREQRSARAYHFPDMHKIKEIISEYSVRIFEKTRKHHDFLHYQIGTGKVPTSFEIDYRKDDFVKEKDPLVEKANQLNETYQSIDDAPVTISLMEGPIGYIGNRHFILNHIEHMVLELATFHSYHDVQFLFCMKTSEYNTLNNMRWLKHFHINAIHTRGLVHDKRTRDQVLTSFYSIIKERMNKQNEQTREEVQFLPHYVMVISDMGLLMDHVILEYINMDLTKYGISLIFIDDVYETLPEHVVTVIDMKTKTHAELIMHNETLVNEHVTPALLDEQFDKEKLYRKLANINHVENLKNTIPESISFMQLYKAKYTDELDIEKRWKENQSYKNMAVPLGVRGKDDIVHLNLHEKAHGPHGLIAGTTGSGKSEIIQSYILSLAVNFHPHEVAFLLIDYKGGGMANLFKDLPHLVGTITNLDGASSMRALTSIKAELKKRQRLFNENEVNHINQYHKLIQDGKQLEPMPHLFLISDEFAELKQEQPDFMKELVSTARIGRSLGIHLILATQKPSGVVNDQIWSNSKFKLALKVQNKQDSNEILKTPDAADITLPGRAYLQVGNNEIYELFQSAWSGANYAPDDSSKTIDKTLYQINHYGQYENVTRDLSGLDEGKVVETKTELEAVIDEVKRVNDALQVTKVKTPWLPPLKKVIYQEELVETDFKKLWSDDRRKVELLFGYKDVPEEQLQAPLIRSVDETGHIALIGSPGYGRTTFLHNIITYIARHQQPDQAHMYLFDFGTNGLMPMVDFPHVADYFTIDQQEKIKKVIRILNDLINERKQILSKYRVVSMNDYEKVTSEIIPNIFVIIDNYDGIKDTPIQESFETLLMKLSREGLALNIHLISTASRANALRMQLITNIKTKIALHLFDKSELSNVIGTMKVESPDIIGRAIMNDDNKTIFQIPLAYNQEIQVNEAIKNEIKEMHNNYDKALPKKVPMMPESMDYETNAKVFQFEEYLEKGKVPIGLEYNNVNVIAIDINKHAVITSERPSETSHIAKTMLRSIEDLRDKYSFIIADFNGEYDIYQDNADLYFNSDEGFETMKEVLLTEIENRKNGNASSKHSVYFINDFKSFIKTTNITDSEIKTILTSGHKFGVTLILTGAHKSSIESYESQFDIAKKTISQMVLGIRITDQQVINFGYITGEQPLKELEAYYINNNEYFKMRWFE
ncbi:type VII secretion protein EssC [Macrococcus armenti]|uniref:type VII secretion protein EssC n=1 Tax=Macrococcus armenti TaxID=2875764 RepID=UPI001CCD72BA|nr:type VII secretion protein EssC [Macrococcus armenti]UBH14812.1 type VII secretion protein EssC [Macrococcus armenti]UBH17171.1 type VII secretion protein EssC [Macrococcus armenti]UBH19437.1 type VII secretion protein EssC [Macrococcus armenti]